MIFKQAKSYITNQQPYVVILPESSIILNTDSTAHLAFHWHQLAPASVLVCGTLLTSEHTRTNALHALENGTIAACHYKQCGVPFIEQLPRVCRLFFSYNCLFERDKELHTDNRATQPITILETDFAPYICSEFFCTRKQAARGPLIVCSNDQWSPCAFFKQLMLSEAILKALEWHTDILYVSYAHAFFITKEGRLVPLLQA
jgi:apolipoprotein N-acyltransferase